jgi:acyl-CoA synthetase (AMP-forming)/AMP-acid ligase II
MNIYPSEIESILKRNEEITDLSIYSQEGKIIVEVLLSQNFKDLSVKDVIQLCSRTLPSYLMPDKIKIVNQISVSATGKRIHAK